jgi:hypothetical protein
MLVGAKACTSSWFIRASPLIPHFDRNLICLATPAKAVVRDDRHFHLPQEALLLYMLHYEAGNYFLVRGRLYVCRCWMTAAGEGFGNGI